MRVCYKCKNEKDESEFHKDKSQCGGLSYECKKCKSEFRKIKRMENPEHYRAMQVRNLARNLKAIRESQAKHLEKNRDKILERRRKHYELNREEITQKENARRKSDKFREYSRNYHRKLRSENKDLVAAWNKVSRAIRMGKIIAGTKCEKCGSVKKIEGHHADYSKPLDLQWLCKKCHVWIHKSP